MPEKGTLKTEKVLGKAAGVKADGTIPGELAYEKVRRLYQEQLKLVRERLRYYKAEEKYLMEQLAAMPLPGQMELELGEEMAGWEAASDEALLKFERELDSSMGEGNE